MNQLTQNLRDGIGRRSEWDTLTLEQHYGVGHAAHRNRGRNTGQKVHVVGYEVIVARSDEQKPGQMKVGAVFSARPLCGVTQGQHAAKVAPSLTADHVTCSRCQQWVDQEYIQLSR
jgi:hypothetical protein